MRQEDIEDSAKLIDDLGMNSMDSVELIMALEEVFDIYIPDEDARKLPTVDDVIKHIEKKISEGREK